jgi:hypothetical protein
VSDTSHRSKGVYAGSGPPTTGERKVIESCIARHQHVKERNIHNLVFDMGYVEDLTRDPESTAASLPANHYRCSIFTKRHFGRA